MLAEVVLKADRRLTRHRKGLADGNKAINCREVWVLIKQTSILCAHPPIWVEPVINAASEKKCCTIARMTFKWRRCGGKDKHPSTRLSKWLKAAAILRTFYDIGAADLIRIGRNRSARKTSVDHSCRWVQHTGVVLVVFRQLRVSEVDVISEQGPYLLLKRSKNSSRGSRSHNVL